MYRVLIADDEQLMREALSIMISKVKGFVVAACVSDGISAVDYCSKNPIDIVFMDIIMPGKTGMEASKEILLSNPSINIYILSAYSNFEFAREALKIKIKEYILKPVSLSKIRIILETHNKYYGMSYKQSETLLSLLDQNNYGDMYGVIPKVVNEIYDMCGDDTDRLFSIFQSLQRDVIHTSKWIEGIEIESEDIFPVTEIMIKDKRHMEFWLFNIMDFMFQKNGISKYPVLKNVLHFIDEHMRENIGLSDIIDKCAISQGYLSRIFKLRFNVSVMEYLHMKKLMLAKVYLTFTKFSVAEIAFRLGYNESNYFGKVFKKYEHVTAFQYRKDVMDIVLAESMEDGEKCE